MVTHANALQTGLNDVETHVSTLQTWREGLDPRVSALETNAIAGQPASVESGAQPNDQHFVLSGNKIVPLVAGLGVVIDTVSRGLFQTDYLRVTAGPWVGGRMRDDGVKLSSVGRYDYTTSGRTGDVNGMLFHGPTRPTRRTSTS